MATYLFKTEPSEYSFADLVREKRCVWSGVTNNTALLHLRTVKKGDEIFVYHTGDERAIVGMARAATGAYEDPAQPGLNDQGRPKFAVVDLIAVRAAPTPLTLAAIKSDPRFARFPLVVQGRLSVMAVAPEYDATIRTLAGL